MSRCLLLPLVLSLCAATVPLSASGADDAARIALDHIEAHAADLGLRPGDTAELEVVDRYVSKHTGVTHVYVRQMHDSIPVVRALVNVNVTADGAILHVGNRAVPNLLERIETTAPALEAEEAVLRAAAELGIATPRGDLVRLETLGGPQKAARFAPSGISRVEIPVELVYEPVADGTIRLAWRMEIQRTDSPDWLDLRIDAVTGELLAGENLTVYDHFPRTDARSERRPAAPRAGQVPRGGPSYSVIPFPAIDPNEAGQSTVGDESEAEASPLGWHDDDTTQFTDTRGNNVSAQDDLDGDNLGGTRPDGGGSLEFNFGWNPAVDPEAGTNLEASIVNLFYWNNIMHDLVYQYGFDEDAGNFQESNFEHGGIGGDAVNADALDGSAFNNANFATPGDGVNPRMQMFRWLADPIVQINAGPLAGDYDAGNASFGPRYTVGGVTGDIVYAADGTAPVNDGCEVILDDLSGKIGMIDRGTCEFSAKVLNAQNAGALAAIVVNDANCSGTPCPNGTISMGAGASGGSVTIPSAMIGQADGQAIKDELLARATVNATVRRTIEDRDSDFDNGVIAHEYGHGISIRLTGGPGNVGCLNTCLQGFPTCTLFSEQAGEGWSDFWAMMIGTREGDRPSTPRGVGNYLVYQDSSGSGIRNFPYTTDQTINPQTYADVATTNAPHGIGEIWMAMLWDLHWELVARYGFDADLYAGSGGNNLLIQLVLDGMKLQPCSPTFTDARDAILAADVALTGGQNECEIWRSFANRGVGELADSGTFARGNETEDFTLPAACAGTGTNFLFDDGFESGDTSRW